MSIVTLTVPREWLISLLPDYDTLSHDETWMRESAGQLISKAVMANLIPGEREDSEPHRRLNFRIPALAAAAATQRAREAGVSLGTYCKGLLAALIAAETPVDTVERKRVVDLADAGLLGQAIGQAIVQTPGQAITSASGNPLEIREEQITFFRQLREVLNEGVIGLNEAATGTGKTLSILCAAAEYAIKHKTRVAIAAPTVGILDQFSSTFRDRLIALDLDLECRVVLGRQNFVSPTEVTRLLEANAIDFDPEPVWDWLGSGGYAAARGIGHDVPWLASSLEAVCPMFPLSDCQLSPQTPADDPAQMTYRAQFDEDRDLRAELLFVTHAMLANDMRSRMVMAKRDEGYRELNTAKFEKLAQAKDATSLVKATLIGQVHEIEQIKGELVNELTEQSGLLPFFTAVVVDEAHQFENSVSSALSEYVSLKAFSRRLKDYSASKLISAAACKRVADAIQGLSDACGSRGEEGFLTLSSNRDDVNWITQHLDTIVEATRRLKPPPATASAAEQALYQCLVREAATVGSASRFSTTSKAYLQFSPTKAWPQIYIGKSSVQDYMSLLWSSMRAGACVSATLYLKNGEADSAAYQRMLLAVPEGRAREYRPVVPGWLYRPVTGLWTPAKATVRGEDGDRLWLRPPTRSDKLAAAQHARAEAAWLSDVAQTVHWIHATAAGGVMVAMTSYDSVAALAELLTRSKTGPLVVAERGVSLSEQSREFLRASQRGDKPVWLAVGGAWTGLDVGGHDPYARLFGKELAAGDDNVFTDLVVPRLPFGVNRSITHMVRMQTKPQVQWDFLDALFRLKQVMGRPVRRAGLSKNRRFFLLDGRLNDARFLGWKSSVLSLLRAYRARTLELEEVQHGAPQ